MANKTAVTEEKYDSIFEEFKKLLLVQVDFQKHPYTEFMTRSKIQDDITDEDIKFAIIRDHRTDLFNNATFPDIIFDKILEYNRGLGRGLPDRALKQGYIHAFDALRRGENIKDDTLASNLARASYHWGKALNRMEFAFEYRKALLSKFSDPRVAIRIEALAEHNFNRKLFEYLLPKEIVDRLIEEDIKYSELQMHAIMRGKSMMLEYPENSTEEERELIRKDFENTHLRTKLAPRRRKH